MATPGDPRAAIEAACRTLARAADQAAMHVNACVRCGLCGESCHIYRSAPEPENLPGAKLARMAGLFRRYHSFLGRHVPWLVGATDLTPESLAKLIDAVFGRCTGCGRCGLNCSAGLDVAGVLRLGRQMLVAAKLVPEGLQRTVDNQIQTGNQMAIPPDELLSTAEWLSQDLALERADEAARVPVDQPGARFLYLVNPREVKFFPLSLLAAAGVFHAAGESWTLSSRCFDVTNYGLFAGDDQAAGELTRRAVEEARVLGVSEIILSECGHGFRAFRWEGPNWLGREYPLPVRSVLGLLDDYLAAGRLKVNPALNTERVTLHDPCNLVRWGGVVEPQRRILRRVVQDFVEMTPNREQNFCCGGGGGQLAMAAYKDRRIRAGGMKAQQIRATGAEIVVAPCHNCIDQLMELNKEYKLGIQIKTVAEMVAEALVTPEPPASEGKATE